MKIFNFQFPIFNKKGLHCGARAEWGFSLVEMIIMISIVVFSILSIWQVYTFFVKTSLSNPAFFQASFLAEEGIEAVKFMRDHSWGSNIAPLSSGESYSLVFDGVSWQTTNAIALIDNHFDRRAIFSDVYRDVSGNISTNGGGSLDANTKKVEVEVSWFNKTSTSTRKITTYVSNIFEN